MYDGNHDISEWHQFDSWFQNSNFRVIIGLNQMVHKHRSQTILHAFPRGVTSFVNSRNHFLYLVEILQQSIKCQFISMAFEMDQTTWKGMHEKLTMKIFSWFEITRVFGKMWFLQKIIGDKDMVAQNCHKLLILCAFWTNLCWSDDNLTSGECYPSTSSLAP